MMLVMVADAVAMVEPRTTVVSKFCVTVAWVDAVTANNMREKKRTRTRDEAVVAMVVCLCEDL